MNEYDTVIILHKKVNKADFKMQMFQTISCLKEYTEMGIKRLAYDINGQNEAEYIEIIWNGNEKEVQDLEKRLRPNNYVLKFITVKRI